MGHGHGTGDTRCADVLSHPPAVSWCSCAASTARAAWARAGGQQALPGSGRALLQVGTTSPSLQMDEFLFSAVDSQVASEPAKSFQSQRLHAPAVVSSFSDLGWMLWWFALCGGDHSQTVTEPSPVTVPQSGLEPLCRPIPSKPGLPSLCPHCSLFPLPAGCPGAPHSHPGTGAEAPAACSASVMLPRAQGEQGKGCRSVFPSPAARPRMTPVGLNGLGVIP